MCTKRAQKQVIPKIAIILSTYIISNLRCLAWQSVVKFATLPL